MGVCLMMSLTDLKDWVALVNGAALALGVIAFVKGWIVSGVTHANLEARCTRYETLVLHQASLLEKVTERL